ncbi:putative UTP--glucose-1-phosphate uridylyltransferase [Hypsizygus marmoreus]|uniref:UTP--glucose-1-phosphate uridylyltransferase n=1 Tax=Hypsizygus marmoreus TaxID=39966 RepID=A0A369JZG6_HYPMA|nr:putative UTP--glucose-1-phosphate uridylyltransferase [Hypsizygus marmoreus]
MSLNLHPTPHIRRIRRRAAKKLQGFATGFKSKAIWNEVKGLVNTVSDPTPKKAFAADMQSFSSLLARYTTGTSEQLDWAKVKSPTADHILPYEALPQPADHVALLKKLAVVKVNGGLGTSMGMQGAKSALEVIDGSTFLDLTIQQIAHLNETHHVDVPLLLMTSFGTHEDTLRIIQKYDSVRIMPFMQSKYPRIMKDSLLPCPQHGEDDKASWYPPGHGDLYAALSRNRVLDRLLKEGKEYLFVSNSDNLGAVVDPRFLQYMIDTRAEFLMEVTDKTKADIQGGTLIDYDGTIRLLEIAQVSAEHSEEFESVRKFSIFNTNNLWIDLRVLKKVMNQGAMELEIIPTPKITDDGRSVIQLETAAGAAIRHFNNVRGINVPRSRFLPVKNCSDLLLIKSDIYYIKHGRPVLSQDRMFGTTPVVKLDDHFKKIRDFQTRLKSIPRIIDLDHLTVSGNVYFGRNVTLRGTVIIVANEGQRIDIPDGCVLENRLVSGNLNMTEL